MITPSLLLHLLVGSTGIDFLCPGFGTLWPWDIFLPYQSTSQQSLAYLKFHCGLLVWVFSLSLCLNLFSVSYCGVVFNPLVMALQVLLYLAPFLFGRAF